MILHEHSYVSYLLDPDAHKCVRVFFFLGFRQNNFLAHMPLDNVPVHIEFRVMHKSFEYATEVELIATLNSFQTVALLKITLVEMGHKHMTTTISMDKYAAMGIINDTEEKIILASYWHVFLLGT